MFKSNLKLKLLSSFLITVFLISTTVNAQQNAERAEQTTNTQSTLLERLLSLFKAQENSLTTRGDVCFISPGQLGEQLVWSDRPLLVMRGEIPPGKINLYSSSANFNYEKDPQLLWTQKIARNTPTILYQGEKLQPGLSYDWEFVPQDKQYDPISFILMEEPERQLITQELAAIAKKLQTEGATAEDIAIAQADYFIKQQLWSDAIQQLHSLPNPSSALTAKVIEIEQHLCEKNNGIVGK